MGQVQIKNSHTSGLLKSRQFVVNRTRTQHLAVLVLDECAARVRVPFA
jgi:hypothetical protein